MNHKTRVVTQGRVSFVKRQWINKERKQKLENHPHKDYFIFKQCGSGFNWYIRSQTENNRVNTNAKVQQVKEEDRIW